MELFVVSISVELVVLVSVCVKLVVVVSVSVELVVVVVSFLCGARCLFPLWMVRKGPSVHRFLWMVRYAPSVHRFLRSGWSGMLHLCSGICGLVSPWS